MMNEKAKRRKFLNLIDRLVEVLDENTELFICQRPALLEKCCDIRREFLSLTLDKIKDKVRQNNLMIKEVLKEADCLLEGVRESEISEVFGKEVLNGEQTRTD